VKVGAHVAILPYQNSDAFCCNMGLLVQQIRYKTILWQYMDLITSGRNFVERSPFIAQNIVVAINFVAIYQILVVDHFAFFI
jgi:hypothetical protein